MIRENMQDALNEQINHEFYSAYVYTAMSAYFSSKNLNGFANWMRVQAQEELQHAMRVYDFLVDRDGEIELQDIKCPPKSWDSPLAAFQKAKENETELSARINDLVDLSLEVRDHATNTFLQWFVSEQVEEEAAVNEIIDTLKLVGDDGNGLFLVDRDLAQRTLKPEETAEASE